MTLTTLNAPEGVEWLSYSGRSQSWFIFPISQVSRCLVMIAWLYTVSLSVSVCFVSFDGNIRASERQHLWPPLIKTFYRSILCPTNLVPHSGHCFECVRWCKMNYLNYWQQYVFEGIICVQKCNDDMSTQWEVETWGLASFPSPERKVCQENLGFYSKDFYFFLIHIFCVNVWFSTARFRNICNKFENCFSKNVPM